MKKIYLFTFFFVFVVCVSPVFSFSSKPAAETTFTGNLFYGAIPSVKQSGASVSKPDKELAKTEYWLKLDKPLVFAPGSKSQRVVNHLEIIFSSDLQENARQFVNHHVKVNGQMDCEMHYTPWTATCTLKVTQITLSK
ncbi:MAG TPA: hypothetical protein P5294_00595 [Smithellaceae bacterium]|nr:hypothetical protein [Smithellaceae bacterium]HRS88360.1 hypothetical protein [Smithellaceae bacterium]HRV25005.1 hypothetical protein [Smithellaceae bacterium]